MIQRRYVRNFGESKRAARGDDVGGFVAAGEKNPIKQIAHFKKKRTQKHTLTFRSMCVRMCAWAASFAYNHMNKQSARTKAQTQHKRNHEKTHEKEHEKAHEWAHEKSTSIPSSWAFFSRPTCRSCCVASCIMAAEISAVFKKKRNFKFIIIHIAMNCSSCRCVCMGVCLCACFQIILCFVRMYASEFEKQ